MDEPPRSRQPVAGGVLPLRRGVVVEADRMLDEKALPAVGEGRRLRSNPGVGATPGSEVELARLIRSSLGRELVDERGDRLPRELASEELGLAEGEGGARLVAGRILSRRLGAGSLLPE